MNNLKTGIHAKSLVLPYENLADPAFLVDLRPHAGRGGFGRA